MILFVLIVFFWAFVFVTKIYIFFRRLVVGSPSVMRCHKNRDVGSFGRD